MNPFKSYKPNIFVSSDLHLDHANIIKYCRRPFSSIDEMNTTLVSNWNSVVNINDIVLFLGDLCLAKSSKDTDYWLSQLHGSITFIRGNHDKKSSITPLLDNASFTYQGIPFYLVHDPGNCPSNYSDWILSGHHHNNHPIEFPLVNSIAKVINVSTELTDYKPIRLDALIKLMK